MIEVSALQEISIQISQIPGKLNNNDFCVQLFFCIRIFPLKTHFYLNIKIISWILFTVSVDCTRYRQITVIYQTHVAVIL